MSAKLAPGLRRFARELFELVRTAKTTWRMLDRGHRIALMFAVAIMALGGFSAMALPILSGRLVDRVASGIKNDEPRSSILSSVLVVLGLVAGLIIVREFLQVIRRYLVESACTRIERRTCIKVVSHLMQADLFHLTHEKIGSLHGRIFRSIGGYMRLLRLSFLDFFPAIVIGVFAIVTAIWKQPWLGLAILGVIPASFAITTWQLISQKRVRLRLMKVNEEMDGIVVELLGGLDYVRAANTNHHELEKVARAAEQKRAKELKHHVAMSFFGGGKALVEGGFHITVLGMAAFFAVQGQISFGDILVFSMLYGSAMAPLNEVHRVLDEGHEASLRVLDLQALLAMPIDVSFKSSTPEPDHKDRANVAIRTQSLRVDHRLPNGDVRCTLDGVDLEIHHGETIGVAGRSGCGKSTLLKAIMRLLHPCAGNAWIMGVPLTELSREALARLIGYVGQNPFVFAGTIAENIAYGRERHPAAEEIIHAAKRACIHDEIMALPMGYQTSIAEKGANLSGGQRQRLALARVFLHNPPIMILDEATSALDTISERLVQQAIGTASRDRTVIMVAHRLSTFADADRIFVFEAGRLVETGPYSVLLAKGGVFAELVRATERPDGAAF